MDTSIIPSPDSLLVNWLWFQVLLVITFTLHIILVNLILGGCFLAICFIWMGGFEYSREIARKPFVIYNYMYSNGVLVNQTDSINETGFLQNAKWTKIHE